MPNQGTDMLYIAFGEWFIELMVFFVSHSLHSFGTLCFPLFVCLHDVALRGTSKYPKFRRSCEVDENVFVQWLMVLKGVTNFWKMLLEDADGLPGVSPRAAETWLAKYKSSLINRQHTWRSVRTYTRDLKVPKRH